MFESRLGGCEQFEEVASGHSGAAGVQPLRIKPLHFQGGSWVIPSINRRVPLVLKSTAQEKVAAEFSLEANANGICLPEGKFTNLPTTILEQFTKAASEGMAKDDPLSMQVDIAISDDKVEISLLATHSIETIKLGPMLTRLNEASDGLGWFVYQCIEGAAADGFPIYSPSHLMCLMEMLWFEPGLTDAEFAKFLRDQFQEDEVTKKMTDEQFISEYGPGHTPSDAQKAFGGLAWILRSFSPDAVQPTQPHIPNEKAVVRFLKTMPEGDLKEVVKATLAMKKEVERKSSNLKTQRIAADEDDDYGYVPNPYGASCILLWDESDLLHELIQGYEESEMNGGEATEVHMVFRGDPTDQASIVALIQSFKDVVARYKAVGNVLKHFK